jgi:hypothetical protein
MSTEQEDFERAVIMFLAQIQNQIYARPNMGIFIRYLCAHPLLTWEFIQLHPEIEWDYHILSQHSAITFDIIRNNPMLLWNYVSFSKNNSNITWKIVINNPDFNWYPECLLKNPHLQAKTEEDGYVLK